MTTAVRSRSANLITWAALDAWKSAAKDGQPPQNTGLRKGYVLDEIKQLDGEGQERRLRFTISTASIDREGDTINPEGWRLDNYRKNPVVLWAHDYHELPVAKSVEINVLMGKLVSINEFPEPDLHPFGDTVFRLLKAGYLNAASVGFLPLKWLFNEERPSRGWGTPVDFLEQELLEHSIVPVPSNPEALVEARSAGIDLVPLKAWAERVLDEWHEERGIWLPKSQIEQVFKLLDSKTTIALVTSDMAGIAGIAGEQAKGVVPRDVSRDTAPEDTPWEAPTLSDFTDETWEDLSDSEKRRIAGHFAWAVAMPPERFGDLKLPHHRPSDGAVVWRGVAAATARLNQSDIPDADMAAVKRHLRSHYEQFDKPVPDILEESAEARQESARAPGKVSIRLGRESSSTQVVLDGLDISCLVTSLELRITTCGQPELHLVVNPSSLELEADGQTLLKQVELLDGSAAEAKRGRVLSAANEQRIRAARDNLNEVLEQLDGQPEEDSTGPDTVSQKASSEAELESQPEAEPDGVLEIEDDNEEAPEAEDRDGDEVEVDAEDLKTIIRQSVRSIMNSLTGRLD